MATINCDGYPAPTARLKEINQGGGVKCNPGDTKRFQLDLIDQMPLTPTRRIMPGQLKKQSELLA